MELNNSATNNCTGDTCDILEKTDSTTTTTTTTTSSSCSASKNDNNNSSSIKTADSSGGRINQIGDVSNNNSGDNHGHNNHWNNSNGDNHIQNNHWNNSNGDNHVHNNHWNNNSGVLQQSRSMSRDGMSDCDVESGDDKASESGSDVYSGTPAAGTDLASKNSLKSCITSVATSLSVTSTAASPVCNGGVGSGSLSITSVPHVALATTTTTTTTNSTSRSGVTDSLISSSVVITTAIPSQSVIHTTPYSSDHSSYKPTQFSPEFFLSNSHTERTLSHNHHHLHQHHQSHHNSHCCDNSAYARSTQYSPGHRSNQIHDKSPHYRSSPTTCFGRASSSPVILQNNQQRSSSENYPNSHLQKTKTSVNHKASHFPRIQAGSHLLPDGHPPGSEFPSLYSAHPSLRRPDSRGSQHSSVHEDTESRGHQQCTIGNCPSVASNSGSHAVTTTTPTTASISNPHNPQHKHRQHTSITSLHPSSPLPDKSHPNSHHQQRCSSRPDSPLAYLSKRPCRSSPGLHAPAAVSAANGLPVKDPSKQSSSVLLKSQACKRESTSSSQACKRESTSSSSSTAGKDLSDLRLKEQTQNYHSSSGHLHHLGRHHKDKDKERQREKDRDRERERYKTAVSLGVSVPQAVFPTPKPTWPGTQSPLYDPLLQLHHQSPLTPSPAVPSQAPYPSPSPSLTSPLFTLPLPHPPSLPAPGSSSLSTGMFASPIPPAPPCLPPPPSLSSHQNASSQYSADGLIRSQDFLHQDLNNRLLAHRDSSSVALSPSPFIRAETHQHQHQHLHSHMHQHTYGGLSAGPMVPPTPPLIVPNYSAAFTSLLPPGPSGASLASSLQGAFQPKNAMVPGQMFPPFRDREKSVPPAGLAPGQKGREGSSGDPWYPPDLCIEKQGKWCAVHVRVAWEIFHRQQKKLQRDQDGTASSSSASSALKSGADTKPLEPLLRPPSNLLPGGSSIVRPPDSSLLASVARSLPDGIAHPSSSFLSPAANLGLAPFPRPSPYTVPSLLNPLGFSGLGGNMFASVHDMVPLTLSSSLNSSPNEWNRLHRTPSTFPSWPRSDTEKEREREVRKEEGERERRASLNHSLSGLDDSRHKDPESLRPKSRSRSRSPLRNGRIDHHSKSELGSFEKHYDDRRPHSTSAGAVASRLKEDRRVDEMSSLPHHLAEREKLERFHREKLEKDRFERERLERDRIERERIEKEKLLQSAAEREKLFQVMEQREKFFQTGGYLGLSPFSTGLPTHPGLLERRVGLMGHTTAGYPFLERAPVPTAMWNHYDKSTADIFHRLEVERERERMAMMSRLSSIPSHLAILEQERLKDQILREQQEREYELRKQYHDRVPAFTAERLRAADPLALGMYFPRTLSPMFGPGGLASLKSNSPHGIPGVPPPLIPSSSSTAASTMLSARSHDNSPSSSSKSKGCSPADSTSDLKDKREGSSTDPEAHSR